jgi:inhibitor of cysteine peptidase
MTVGDTVSLRLPENPSTGYRWAVASFDEAHVMIVESGFRGSKSVGSGGQAEWQLRGLAAGRTTLNLKRWRPFEGDRSIVERFVITLQIAI